MKVPGCGFSATDKPVFQKKILYNFTDVLCIIKYNSDINNEASGCTLESVFIIDNSINYYPSNSSSIINICSALRREVII